MTTIVKPLPEESPDWEPQPETKTSAAHAAPSSHDFMRGKLSNERPRDKQITKKTCPGPSAGAVLVHENNSVFLYIVSLAYGIHIVDRLHCGG
jgi:hypothetical protein